MKLAHIVSEIAGASLKGDPEQEISGIIPLPAKNEDPAALFWCSDKNIPKLAAIRRGNIICGRALPENIMVPGCNYILVPNPREAFRLVLCLMVAAEPEIEGIAGSARVSPSAVLGSECGIGENVVIERGVILGKKVVVGHNTVIKRNTRIGDNVVIGANCTIGGVGFGYEKDISGVYNPLPHVGGVVIEDGVEIGNNTAIDRAVIGNTFIRKNSKIDNLVHIAHGADIGENSLVIANAMVAGSVKLGRNVWVAPSASILNQMTISDNAVIGMGAVVIKDVGAGETVVGNPARILGK